MLDKASHTIETYGRYSPCRLDLVYRHYSIGCSSASFYQEFLSRKDPDTPYWIIIEGSQGTSLLQVGCTLYLGYMKALSNYDGVLAGLPNELV